MKTFYLRFCILWFFLCTQGYSQDRVDIRGFFPADHLGGEVVRSIAQTGDGSIWFGLWPNGVTRYNGIHWTYFNREDGLPANAVRCLFVDRENTLWCGTTSGLAVYLNRQWTKTNLPVENTKQPPIYAIREVGEGRIWVTSEEGYIYELSQESNPVPVRVPLPESWTVVMDPALSKGNAVRCILPLRNGQILAAISKQGIFSYTHGHWSSIRDSEHDVISLTQRHNGDVWATEANTLLHYDGETWTTHTLSSTIPTCVYETADQTLYAGTNQGLYRHDPDKWELVSFGEPSEYPYIETITQTANDILWVGTRYGAYRITQPIWIKETPSPASKGATCFYTDLETEPLCVDNTGSLYEYSGDQWRFIITLTENPQPGLALYKDHDQTIWILLQDRIVHYSIDEHSVLEVWPLPGSVTGQRMFITSSNRVFIYGNNGVFEKRDDTWQHTPRDLAYLSNNVEFMFEDADGVLWVNWTNTIEHWGIDSRLTFLIGDSFENRNPIESFYKKDNGDLFFALINEGLFSYDNTVRKIASFDTTLSKQPKSLYQSANQTFWIGTNEIGLSAYQNRRWINFTQKHGLPNGKVLFINEHPEGQIWTAIENAGTYRYTPDRAPPETHIPKANRQVTYFDRAFFEMAGIDPWKRTQTNDIVFSWRIHPKNQPPHDEGWSAFTSENVAISPKLKPGEYVFQARVADIDRNIDPTPAQIDFIVIPPFWQTWQFIALSAILVILIPLSYRLLMLKIRESKIAAARYQELDTLKNQFLGMAAHDLRNPLTVILGHAELLSLRHRDIHNQKACDAILASATTMMHIINDFLDVSIIESGNLRLTYSQCNIHTILDKVLSLHEHRANAKMQTIHREWDASIPDLWLDSLKIEQACSNLLTNAIKYSDLHAPIHIRTVLQDGLLTISVIDEGIGMHENEIQHVFQPFKQAESKGDRNEESVGLGLVIVKKIVESHGGTISVTSEWGKGSVFTLHIPALEEEPEKTV